MPGGKVIRGWLVWAVTRDLAEGKSQSSIGRMYGVSQVTISNFARDHAEQVQEVRQQLDDAMAGLWIADKKKRVAVYQNIAEEMLDEDTAGVALGKVTKVEARRAAMTATRAVADELGDIPQRIKVEGGGEPVRHVIEGVDVEDLK